MLRQIGTGASAGGGVLFRREDVWLAGTRAIVAVRATRCVRLGLGAVLAVGAVAAALPGAALAVTGGCSLSGSLATCTYVSGSNQFIVPSGVSSLNLDVVGGSGGSTEIGGTPGRGAELRGPLKVVPGESLYAVVGANGQSSPGTGQPCSTFIPGAFNGGGTARIGGGGGGASDIRTDPTNLNTRLVIAGGGGGAGIVTGPGPLPAGDAGAPGGSFTDPNTGFTDTGGGPGTQTSGGAGGLGNENNGGSGSFGQGGSDPGGSQGPCGGGGGGGGGGWYGGGSGGDGFSVDSFGFTSEDGGGGGGSSLTPPGLFYSVGLDSTATPRIVISYTLPSSSDVPPSADLVPGGSLNGGSPYSLSLNGSASSDPDQVSDGVSGIASWKVKWGDGTASTAGTGNVPSNLSHTYAHPGTFLTTLTVTEGDGNASDSASVIVTVTRAPSALTAAPGTVHTLSNTVSMSATLKRTDTRTPLAGKTVAFGTNNALVCVAVTNSSGVAACTGPLSGSALTAVANGYVVSFLGDQDTQSSSAKGALSPVVNAVDLAGARARVHAPRSIRAATLHALRGTAGAGTRLVMISLVRVGAHDCSQLAANGGFVRSTRVRGWCIPSRSRAADGTRSWSLRLTHTLRPGAYELYVWTLDTHGRVRVTVRALRLR